MNPMDRQIGKQQRIRMGMAGGLILLFTLGMAIDEADFLGSRHTSATAYLQVYSAFLLMLVYIVPFSLLMRRLCRRYKLSGFEMLTAVACGAFIPAAFAGEINDGFTSMMKQLMGSAYSDAWLGSAETAIVEELLKLGTAALLLYLFHRKSRPSYLITGMCVGMGFQIEEDFSYITDSGFKHVNAAFPAALDRIVGALGSHWAYTGVTAVGLYLIVSASSGRNKRKGLLWILLVMANHFLYDSPIGSVPLFSALLAAAVVLPVILLLKTDWSMSETEMDAKLSHSYAQSIAGEGRPMDEVFNDLKRDLK